MGLLRSQLIEWRAKLDIRGHSSMVSVRPRCQPQHIAMGGALRVSLLFIMLPCLGSTFMSFGVCLIPLPE